MLTNTASKYFNANWNKYQESVSRNALYHHEMFSVLDEYLNKNFMTTKFSLLDIGCGDSNSIVPILADKPIEKYIGVDAAADVLKMATINTANLPCDNLLICDDMLTAIENLTMPVDIIFTSYAVHHLSSQQKFDFIRICKDKLKANGVLLMIDGILNDEQTRDEWLEALHTRFKIVNPSATPEELEIRMQHPRADDYPESINTFEEIAKTQNWQNFQVLLKKDIFAFMVFTK